MCIGERKTAERELKTLQPVRHSEEERERVACEEVRNSGRSRALEAREDSIS